MLASCGSWSYFLILKKLHVQVFLSVLLLLLALKPIYL